MILKLTPAIFLATLIICLGRSPTAFCGNTNGTGSDSKKHTVSGAKVADTASGKIGPKVARNNHGQDDPDPRSGFINCNQPDHPPAGPPVCCGLVPCNVTTPRE